MATDLLADNNNRKYKEADYWNLRFQNEDSYEWLLTYNDIKDKLDKILHKYDKSAKILQLGCGNSNFANDMFNDGFIDITNIDISHVCVEKMSRRFPNMRFLQMDMTSLTFEDHSFDIVIEKATLDSLLVDCKSPWDLTDPSQLAVLKCLEQVKRVLRPGGVFLSLTFSPPHFRVPLLASPGLDWAVEVAVCGGRDTLLDYYLLSCRHGDPGPALAKWAVGRGRNTLDISPAPCSISYSSDEESEEYITRINTSCFDTDTETDTETESSSTSAAADS